MQILPIKKRALYAGACLLLFGWLTGCASWREVPVTVQSYSRLSEPLEATGYRLERLPSQQDDSGRFAPILAKAEFALAAAGLQRDDKQGRWILQVSAESDVSDESPWPRYYSAYSPWWPYAPYGFGPAWGPFYWDLPPARPIYRRSVRLLLRDSQSGQLVYETSAEYRGMRSNALDIFAVLFRAALQDFPNAQQDKHTVRLPLSKQADLSRK